MENVKRYEHICGILEKTALDKAIKKDSGFHFRHYKAAAHLGLFPEIQTAKATMDYNFTTKNLFSDQMMSHDAAHNQVPADYFGNIKESKSPDLGVARHIFWGIL
eukprot:15364772-Ditylum_brightwellii.AAC.1